jgi:hypothetical protein
VRLLRLLARPLGLDQAAGGHELDPIRQQLAQALVLAHAQVLVLEAEPQRALRPALLERGRRLLRRALLVEAGDLGLGALDVAEVGDEATRVGADDRHRRRPGEAREVADVGQVGHEQRVGLALAQPRRHAVGTAHSASLRRCRAVR